MNRTEIALVDLVRLRYEWDTRSFDAKVRNLLASNNHSLSDAAKGELKKVVPEDVQMGNVLR